jgi:hypothetical protein
MRQMARTPELARRGTYVEEGHKPVALHGVAVHGVFFPLLRSLGTKEDAYLAIHSAFKVVFPPEKREWRGHTSLALRGH